MPWLFEQEETYDTDQQSSGQTIRFQCVVSFKITNQTDEDAIDAEIGALKKVSDVPHDVTTRLKHIILSVNGSDDKAVVRKFVDEEMLAKDARSFREYIRNNVPDVDMKFDYKCDRCDYERRSTIPIGASFLWPDIDN
jgi:hypothetical protein